MKRIIAPLLLPLLLIPTNSYAGKGDITPSGYTITKNVPDNSLSTKEAVFSFTFKNIPWPAKIKGSCNKAQKTITTDEMGMHSLKLTPGKYIFQFFYTDEFFEVYTDSIEINPGYRIEIDINFMSSIYPVIMDKPVIYAYAPVSAPIHIDLELKGEMLFTYPTYQKGWDFTTNENGEIKMNNQQYKYLFWEGETVINNNQMNWNEGFVVKKENLLTFFEEKLTAMGLSSIEQQDYITYWVPLMNKNEKNYIHFIFNEEYNEYANISITPKPDNMFRVFMLWMNAAHFNEVNIPEQTIPSFKREGFTIVEWGGSQLPELQHTGW